MEQAIQRILAGGERVTAQALKRLPDGTFEAEDFIDYDGIDERPTPCESEGHDFASPICCRSSRIQPTNCRFDQRSLPSLPLCTAKATFKAITSPHAPANDGNFRALQLLTDPGSIFHALPPSPVSTYWETDSYVGDLIMKALAPQIPSNCPLGTFSVSVEPSSVVMTKKGSSALPLWNHSREAAIR